MEKIQNSKIVTGESAKLVLSKKEKKENGNSSVSCLLDFVLWHTEVTE